MLIPAPSVVPATDVTKHAVLGKFNEIRPGMYREFMKVCCQPPTSLQWYKRCLCFSSQ